MKKYRTIVVDPPWAYSDKMSSGVKGWVGFGQRRREKGRVRGAANHYDLMSTDDLMALPVGEWAEDDAHLYLWTTNVFHADADRLAVAWGFRPITMLTWVKPQIGMGHYYRNTTEHVVFAVRGSLKLMRQDLPTHFIAPRGRHSEKPDAFYDLIETASPEPRIDVFARRHRMGWDVYGNEVYSDIPLVNP